MTVPWDVEGTRDELRTVLDRCEVWLRAAAGAPQTPAEWPRELRGDADTVKRLRTRAASALLNVALLGAFSSGKSFLLSGLQGGLELVEVPTADGQTADKFVGLRPSSPVPTTACPASVVPVDDHTKAGYAYSRDELQEGVSGVAVPVFSAGVVTASLSVVVPVNRDAELQNWIADLSEAAERMSHELDAARRQSTE
ncbi:IclR family transcriptional regulator C-terminal domain-containing protein [Streptomyces sp. NPDC006274]|uniref:IclR family transcriptional regulator domain-containing protein n=1 Tax=unclassified Streptomyces TaxID=2593676 RepID=UPI0033A0F811